MPELLLGLDIGTTTLTACVFTAGGDLLGQAAAPVRTTTPQPGHVEQDAERIWRSTRAVIRAALAKADRKPADLAAIGVTSQRTSALFWDRQTGKPLTPLVVWSDLRGMVRAGELQAKGFAVYPQMASAKLEMMLAAIPDAASLAAQGRLAWGNIDAFVIFKLSGGAHLTDRSQAWPTGYLNLGTMGWNDSLIEVQNLPPSAFPTLVDTWGELATTDARLFGATVAIAADIGDQQGGMVGQGCETPGAGKITFGTSATVDVCTGAQFVFAGPTVPPFLLSTVTGETRWCIEGMVYSAGSALDWLRKAFHLGGHAHFERMAASAADSSGVYVLPALQGLGAPYGDLARRAVIGGLSQATGPSQIAHAGLEGVACRVREVVDHIYAAGNLTRPEILRADGGLTNSEAMMQTQADILGVPVARHALREATACGAAICAGRGVGLLGPSEVAGFVRHDRTFEPKIGADESQARFETWKRRAHGPG